MAAASNVGQAISNILSAQNPVVARAQAGPQVATPQQAIAAAQAARQIPVSPQSPAEQEENSVFRQITHKEPSTMTDAELRDVISQLNRDRYSSYKLMIRLPANASREQIIKSVKDMESSKDLGAARQAQYIKEEQRLAHEHHLENVAAKAAREAAAKPAPIQTGETAAGVKTFTYKAGEGAQVTYAGEYAEGAQPISVYNPVPEQPHIISAPTDYSLRSSGAEGLATEFTGMVEGSYGGSVYSVKQSGSTFTLTPTLGKNAAGIYENARSVIANLEKSYPNAVVSMKGDVITIEQKPGAVNEPSKITVIAEPIESITKEGSEITLTGKSGKEYKSSEMSSALQEKVKGEFKNELARLDVRILAGQAQGALARFDAFKAAIMAKAPSDASSSTFISEGITGMPFSGARGTPTKAEIRAVQEEAAKQWVLNKPQEVLFDIEGMKMPNEIEMAWIAPKSGVGKGFKMITEAFTEGLHLDVSGLHYGGPYRPGAVIDYSTGGMFTETGKLYTYGAEKSQEGLYKMQSALIEPSPSLIEKTAKFGRALALETTADVGMMAFTVLNVDTAMIGAKALQYGTGKIGLEMESEEGAAMLARTAGGRFAEKDILSSMMGVKTFSEAETKAAFEATKSAVTWGAGIGGVANVGISVLSGKPATQEEFISGLKAGAVSGMYASGASIGIIEAVPESTFFIGRTIAASTAEGSVGGMVFATSLAAQQGISPSGGELALSGGIGGALGFAIGGYVAGARAGWLPSGGWWGAEFQPSNVLQRITGSEDFFPKEGKPFRLVETSEGAEVPFRVEYSKIGKGNVLIETTEGAAPEKGLRILLQPEDYGFKEGIGYKIEEVSNIGSKTKWRGKDIINMMETGQTTRTMFKGLGINLGEKFTPFGFGYVDIFAPAEKAATATGKATSELVVNPEKGIGLFGRLSGIRPTFVFGNIRIGMENLPKSIRPGETNYPITPAAETLYQKSFKGTPSMADIEFAGRESEKEIFVEAGKVAQRTVYRQPLDLSEKVPYRVSMKSLKYGMEINLKVIAAEDEINKITMGITKASREQKYGSLGMQMAIGSYRELPALGSKDKIVRGMYEKIETEAVMPESYYFPKERPMSYGKIEPYTAYAMPSGDIDVFHATWESPEELAKWQTEIYKKHGISARAKEGTIEIKVGKEWVKAKDIHTLQSEAAGSGQWMGRGISSQFGRKSWKYTIITEREQVGRKGISASQQVQGGIVSERRGKDVFSFLESGKLGQAYESSARRMFTLLPKRFGKDLQETFTKGKQANTMFGYMDEETVAQGAFYVEGATETAEKEPFFMPATAESLAPETAKYSASLRPFSLRETSPSISTSKTIKPFSPSASVSRSASRSISASVSASVSESLFSKSISPSSSMSPISPISASPSPSPSPSRSISPSESLSPSESISLSPSPSKSPSPSPSSSSPSPSLSPSPSPSKSKSPPVPVVIFPVLSSFGISKKKPFGKKLPKSKFKQSYKDIGLNLASVLKTQVQTGKLSVTQPSAAKHPELWRYEAIGAPTLEELRHGHEWKAKAARIAPQQGNKAFLGIRASKFGKAQTPKPMKQNKTGFFGKIKMFMKKGGKGVKL
jgi:hypothetical protein